MTASTDKMAQGWSVRQWSAVLLALFYGLTLLVVSALDANNPVLQVTGLTHARFFFWWQSVLLAGLGAWVSITAAQRSQAKTAKLVYYGIAAGSVIYPAMVYLYFIQNRI